MCSVVSIAHTMLCLNSRNRGYTGGGLCEDIKLLIEQRISFDNAMSHRARTSAAARPLSPNKHTPNTPHGKDTEVLKRSSVALEDQSQSSNQRTTTLLGMPTEGRVTYLKLKGDQLLHLAEMARHDDAASLSECEGLAAEALEAYLAAQKEASSSVDNPSNEGSSGRDGSNESIINAAALPELHPLHVELALRISSVLLHLLGRPIEAWEAGYPVYLAAAERPARLGARGLAITQILRDHLACIDIHSGVRVVRQEENNPITDRSSVIICGKKEGGDAETYTGGEWGFLRMTPEFDEGNEGSLAICDRTHSDKLRVLAQVKQARAYMDVLNAKEGRVLLGTMEHADLVVLALKKIFSAYTEKHMLPAQTCSEDGKYVWLQGRKVTPKVYLRHGPYLSWSGFVAVCQDFGITSTTTTATGLEARGTSMASSTSSLHQRLPTKHSERRRSTRGAFLDHQRPPASSSPVSTAAKATRRPGFTNAMLSTLKLGEHGLSGVQACVAFVSACTVGHVVASFPSHGDESGHPGGASNSAKSSRAGLAGEAELMSHSSDKDPAYWRGMERLLLSDAFSADANNGSPDLGLNFRQFVDALARCGLIGFARRRTTSESGTVLTIGGGLIDREGESSGAVYQRAPEHFLSAAERMHAMFIDHMRLHEGRHVDAKLQQMLRLYPSSSNDDGDNTSTILEGENKDGYSRSNAEERVKKKMQSDLEKALAAAVNPVRLRVHGNKGKARTTGRKPVSAFAPAQPSSTRGKTQEV